MVSQLLVVGVQVEMEVAKVPVAVMMVMST